MRKIICLRISDPVPDNARPIGATVEKTRFSSTEIIDEAKFYYDVPVTEEKKKDDTTKRR